MQQGSLGDGVLSVIIEAPPQRGSAQSVSWLHAIMDTRAHIAADAIGSVRAEGLEPGATVIEILARWVDRAIETEQLGEAAQRLAAGDSIVHLLGRAEPLSTRR